VILWN